MISNEHNFQDRANRFDRIAMTPREQQQINERINEQKKTLWLWGLHRINRHGYDCDKVQHSGTGYLHAETDDGPYDVDGCLYCGRCHRSL